MRRAYARTLSPRSFSAGAQLEAHTQPALKTGLMAPAWRLLHVSWEEALDLTFSNQSSLRAFATFQFQFLK